MSDEKVIPMPDKFIVQVEVENIDVGNKFILREAVASGKTADGEKFKVSRTPGLADIIVEIGSCEKYHISMNALVGAVLDRRASEIKGADLADSQEAPA